MDSVSHEEGSLSRELQQIMTSLGAKIYVDGAGKETGSDTGNLIVRFSGNTDAAPLLFNAHMDTVEPGKNIKVVYADRRFTSEGETILGADDKSAIAILIEVMRVIREKNLPHCPLELVFTVCEEIGLLGARNLDFGKFRATIGYALDTTDPDVIVTKAPCANRFTVVIHGKDAHAGVCPEAGVNAIVLASKAISALDLGRIDPETSCNIGIISGGRATNIIPNRVTINGEVRSHDPDTLERVTGNIRNTFEATIDAYRKSENAIPIADIEFSAHMEFPNTNIPESHPVVILARQAARNLNRSLKTKSTGGGADANIFFDKGIITGVIGTGMTDIHSTNESITIDDMVKTTELVLEIIRIHSNHESDG